VILWHLASLPDGVELLFLGFNVDASIAAARYVEETKGVHPRELFWIREPRGVFWYGRSPDDGRLAVLDEMCREAR
jgi:hypothetical protein